MFFLLIITVFKFTISQNSCSNESLINIFINLEKTFSPINILYENKNPSEVSNSIVNLTKIKRYKYLNNDKQQLLQNVTTSQNSISKLKNFTNLNNIPSILKKKYQLLKDPNRKTDQPAPDSCSLLIYGKEVYGCICFEKYQYYILNKIIVPFNSSKIIPFSLIGITSADVQIGLFGLGGIGIGFCNVEEVGFSQIKHDYDINSFTGIYISNFDGDDYTIYYYVNGKYVNVRKSYINMYEIYHLQFDFNTHTNVVSIRIFEVFEPLFKREMYVNNYEVFCGFILNSFSGIKVTKLNS